MKDVSWVLVANGAQARIFYLEKMKSLHELHDFIHPESRMHERDLVDSSPGRAFDSTGPHRHAMEPHSTQKKREVEQFAKMIATYLEQAQRTSSFSRLYIAAAPTFLGIMRKTLAPSVLELVHKEVAKDIVKMNTSEILKEFLEE